MRILLTAGAAALALAVAGCGDSGGDKAATAPTGGSATAAVAAPNGGDWTETVSETPEGGFVMGNPNAPVKVVEFASLTCPHCADFAKNGLPKLVEQYVKTGQVSLELRNFVRDPVDLGASLLARCGGATPFFKLTDQIFAAQQEWIGKLQSMAPAEQQQLQALPPNQVTGRLADKAGLVDFVRVRGIPAEKARSCLGDQAAIDKLVAMNQKAIQDFNISGTPTFLINGSVAEGAASWETLEPQLRAAVG